MMEENHEFRVSAEELEYLKQLALRDESLGRLLRFQKGPHDRGATIDLTRTETRQLREHLTTQLAKVGFDENYSPNEQGGLTFKDSCRLLKVMS